MMKLPVVLFQQMKMPTAVFFNPLMTSFLLSAMHDLFLLKGQELTAHFAIQYPC